MYAVSAGYVDTPSVSILLFTTQYTIHLKKYLETF